MIPLPNKPKIINKQGNKATFEIGPLYSTYGVTIGNTLRRVLLSSLEGSAITQVKIKGGSHEFATIPGLLEDVIMVLVNLRKLRFKNFSNESQTIHLSVKGEKVIKGKDFKLNPQIKLINPEEYIATLTTKNAELDIEAKVENGIGYLQAEETEKKNDEIGVILLDAIFNPVKKVNFRIENMIVGKRTDFEKLSLEIETDGTITPEDAFYKANKILVDHFSLCLEPDKKEEPKEKSDDDPKKIKIEDLKLSVRTKNALLKNNFKTIGGIVRKSKKDILKLEGMGSKAMEEIEKILKKYKLELK